MKHPSSAALASHAQGSQEGKGKGWSKGAYPAGAPAASSMSWQQPPREKPGGEAPSPERDQDKDQDRQKPHEVKPKTATPPVCPVVPESSEPPETTAVYCPECQTWLNGPRQWEDHKIGKKHTKNINRSNAGQKAKAKSPLKDGKDKVGEGAGDPSSPGADPSANQHHPCSHYPYPPTSSPYGYPQPVMYFPPYNQYPYMTSYHDMDRILT